VRLYKGAYEIIFRLSAGFHKGSPPKTAGKLSVQTDFPVAYESPDHIAPSGTKENNNTNKKFVLSMNDFIARRFPGEDKCFLDLGCSGGQLVRDFMDLNWVAAGLEGSDYSLKRKRANWATLAGINLFTCDITKPYQILRDGQPLGFHLITAWEVLEHIATPDLPNLFRWITHHLREGGYFIASTTGTPDVVDGIELHQTQMSNLEWKQFVRSNIPGLMEEDLGLKIYQYVRYNFLHPSFLIYRKASAAKAGASVSARDSRLQTAP
jgi:SAM-dependent methyltransferase